MPSNDSGPGRITLNLSGAERLALAMVLDAYCSTDLYDPDRDILLSVLHKLGIGWHPSEGASPSAEPGDDVPPRGAPGCTCGTPPFAPPEPSDDCLTGPARTGAAHWRRS